MLEKQIICFSLLLAVLAIDGNCADNDRKNLEIKREDFEVRLNIEPTTCMHGQPVFLSISFTNMTDRSLMLGEPPYEKCRFDVEMIETVQDSVESSDSAHKSFKVPKRHFIDSPYRTLEVKMQKLEPHGLFTVSIPLWLMFDMTNYNCKHEIKVEAVIEIDASLQEELSWQMSAMIKPGDTWRSMNTAGDLAADCMKRLFGSLAVPIMLDEAEKTIESLANQEEPEKSTDYERLALLVESIDSCMNLPSKHSVRGIRSVGEWNLNGFREFLNYARQCH